MRLTGCRGQHIGQQTRGDHPSLRQQQAMAEAGRNLLHVVGDQYQGGRAGSAARSVSRATIPRGRQIKLGAVRRAAVALGRSSGRAINTVCARLPRASRRCAPRGARHQRFPACRPHADNRRRHSAPAAAQHRISGRDDEVTHQLIAGYPLRKRRGTQPDPRPSSLMSTRPSRSPRT